MVVVESLRAAAQCSVIHGSLGTHSFIQCGHGRDGDKDLKHGIHPTGRYARYQKETSIR